MAVVSSHTSVKVLLGSMKEVVGSMNPDELLNKKTVVLGLRFFYT